MAEAVKLSENRELIDEDGVQLDSTILSDFDLLGAVYSVDGQVGDVDLSDSYAPLTGSVFYVDQQATYVADASDNTAAYTAARTAATAAGGGVVELPAGNLNIATRLELRDGVSVRGKGRGVSTVTVNNAGVSSSAIIGLSGSTVSDVVLSDFTIDAGYSTYNINAIQVTSGTRLRITRMGFRNVGKQAILLTTCTDCTIDHCRIEDAGGSGGATGFGILFSGGSRNKALHNRIFLTEGMAIGGNTNATWCEVVGNYIDKTGMVAYEGVGYTAGCDYWVVQGNQIYNSMDNGISCSGSDGTIVGNVIDGCQYYGINSAGDRNTIVGNRIRNPGKDVGAYAAIKLHGYDIVVGNVGYDDQGSPTMQYGVKGPADNNIIYGNKFVGYSVAEMSDVGTSSEIPRRLRSKTTTYTAVRGEYVLANGTFTVTLPPVAVDAIVTVKNTGAGTITVATPGSETIDGDAANKTIAVQYVSHNYISDGTNWFEV